MKAARQVVPFQPGEDPFRRLAPPSLETGTAPAGPQTDTMRLGPAVPPRAGEEPMPFPPPMAARPPSHVVPPALQVLRTQPSGDEDLVGGVLARFNQPMVPLASVGELTQAESPLKIDPLPAGRFRWLDAQTIVFEPVDRMPFANTYRAEVRAGAMSALGRRLEKAVSWTFRTPAPELVRSEPADGSDQARPEDSIRLVFNAKTDTATVSKSISLREDGRAIPARVEAAAAPTQTPGNQVDAFHEAIERSRTVVVKPARPMVPGRSYVLSLSKDLVCAEGPTPMGAAKTVRFSTYKPLEVRRVGCTWNDGKKCPHGAPLLVETNNPLQAQRLDVLLRFTPEVEDLKAHVQGAGILITGDFRPSTTYKVRVLPGLKDVFGQTLAKEWTGKVSIGEAQPFVALGRQGLSVLEAAFPPAMPLVAMNAGKATFRVAPVPEAKLVELAKRLNGGYYRERENPLRDLRAAKTQELDLSPRRNEPTRLELDLSPALGKQGRGFAALDVELAKPFNEWGPRHFAAFAQVTDLGITAALSDDRLFAMVATLSKGAAVQGASARLVDETGTRLAEGRTDANGVVELKGPTALRRHGPFALVVETDSDRAFLLLDGHSETGRWLSSYAYSLPEEPPEVLDGFAFSERGIYRPAETAHLSVVAKSRRRGPAGDVGPVPEAQRALAYYVNDSHGREMAKGTLSLSAFGAGSFDVPLAGDAALGTWNVNLAGGFGTSFEVREYRTPEYKVSVSHEAGGRPMLIGAETQAIASGSYFFGAPMADAPVAWRVERERSSYTPPGNDDFSFADFEGDGPWPWGRIPHWGQGPQQVDAGEGRLDSAGRLVVPVKLDPGEEKRGPLTFTVEADVQDANRQQISGRTSILAHRAQRYVGMRLEKSVLQAGESLAAQVVVAGLDGNRPDGATSALTLYRVTYETRGRDEDGEYTEKTERTETAVGACVAKCGAVPTVCRMKVPEAGSYVLRAVAKDSGGRENGAALRAWAYGPGTSWRPTGQVKVDLVPDRKDYRAGDKAKVLVQSPFAMARGFVLVSREGFAEVRPLTADAGGTVFEIDLKEAWIPSIHVSVALARGRDAEPDDSPDDRGRPMFAAGEIDLEIDRAPRRVGLELTPSATALDPGGELGIAVRTTDASGRPIPANVALAVVDEGVLSLIAYATPDPLQALYQPREAATGIADLRPIVMPHEKLKTRDGSRPPMPGNGKKNGGAMMRRMAVMAMPSAPAAGAPMEEAQGEVDGVGGDVPAFAIRTFFASTAYFDGSLRTGADGRAQVRFKLPDNLTEYRIMAIASDAESRAGSADTQVRVRKPLLVRPSLPRFLNLGDRFEAAVVVNNETGFDTELDVLARAVNAAIPQERRHVAIRAGEAKEVRFAAEAGVPGPAKFQFAAVALTQAHPTDAAEIIVPTLIPATAEAFATYGSTTEAVRQSVSPPKDALPGFGGLDVDLSSTALTGLQDAVGYLVDYPYECAEQTTSRILPLVALREILPQFRIGKASDEARRAQLVKEGIGRIVQQQRDDGGWGFWAGSRRSELYLSAYVAFGLQTARAAGAEVPQRTLDHALSFLAARLDHPDGEWERRDHASQSMAVLVLARAQRTPRTHLARLVGVKDLPLFARAWLLEAQHRTEPKAPAIASMLRQFSNAAVETAGSLHFAEAKTESLRLLMHSEDRTDAIVLGALLAVRPGDPMVQKLVRGLMRSRMRGRWSTTQANAYALLALRDYFARFEKEVPKFDARVWWGQDCVAGRRFEGRELAIATTRVPMNRLQGAADVVLAKDGPGRLYWRLGLRYAPKDLRLAAEEQGFAVSRTYLRADKDEPLPRRADGAWVGKAGSDVRVRLQLVVPDRRYFVAVSSPLPAGLEAVDPALATTSRTVGRGNVFDTHDAAPWRWAWWRPWDHEELRDDRAQIFADRLEAGVYDYTYTARATTPGTFVVPPARAEEMYAPETFGRSESAVLAVEP